MNANTCEMSETELLSSQGDRAQLKTNLKQKNKQAKLDQFRHVRDSIVSHMLMPSCRDDLTSASSHQGRLTAELAKKRLQSNRLKAQLDRGGLGHKLEVTSRIQTVLTDPKVCSQNKMAIDYNYSL